MIENKLPSTFDEFSEARKNGFILAKEVKDNGGRIAGIFCTFTPVEIFDAAGIHTVSLCGTSEETIPAAETHLPRNLCPLIKSSYGFALTDKCPYTYFSDIIVGETTCDGKKKMYELLGEIKDTYIMQLPQGIDRPYALDMWTTELQYLINKLEDKFGKKITDEALRKASEYRNEERRARIELMELQKLTPPPMLGRDMHKVLEGSKFSFDQKASLEALKNMTKQVKDEYDSGKRPVSEDKKRILVTGCPISGVMEKTVGVIEDNGGVVVCFENCGGIKPVRRMVDTDSENIVEAIAQRYLEIGCAVMTPNIHRIQQLPQLIDEFKIDGVADIMLQTCHPYSVERNAIKKLCEEHGVPYVSVETDYSSLDVGQLTTRLAAFIEML